MMWCGIKRSNVSNLYRVIVPMCSAYIGEDMIIHDSTVSGKVLTKFLSFEEAVTACTEFNNLHLKYN